MAKNYELRSRDTNDVDVHLLYETTLKEWVKKSAC